MIGKRRTRLSVENLEAMSKIHSYYIANSKSELTMVKIEQPMKFVPL